MKPVHVVLSDGVVVLRAVERSPDRFSDKQPHRLRGKEGGGESIIKVSLDGCWWQKTGWPLVDDKSAEGNEA